MWCSSNRWLLCSLLASNTSGSFFFLATQPTAFASAASCCLVFCLSLCAHRRCHTSARSAAFNLEEKAITNNPQFISTAVGFILPACFVPRMGALLHGLLGVFLLRGARSGGISDLTKMGRCKVSSSVLFFLVSFNLRVNFPDRRLSACSSKNRWKIGFQWFAAALGSFFWLVSTPPKFSMETENHPFENEKHLPNSSKPPFTYFTIKSTKSR